MNNAKTETDSREAYKAKAHDIARLVDVLQMELENHAALARPHAAEDPKCWGKVGDLGKVREDLIDLVGFISGRDRDQIERFLNND